ncbi:MAG: NAD(P)-dependent oxidoreductase [Pseudomonadota bacterium]
MTDRMLQFVSTDQETPEKRPAENRREDFDEIYRLFAAEKAASQAARCSQCGVPFCQDHCPLGNNIPDWLRLVGEGRLKEAYKVSSSTNNFPEVCGRICPQDRLCEGSCVIEQSGHGTVTIGAIETYITETAFANGWIEPVKPAEETHFSVGIIGAGPAGLSAAEELRRAGVAVTIYDRYDRPGGLMIYGIPNFKLDKETVIRRTELLEESGVVFKRNVDIGRTTAFREIRESHDAVLIATGVYNARQLTCPRSPDAQVIPALSFLTASNRRGLGDAAEVTDAIGPVVADQRVVVIGGGDTAMDCVRTAIRQGASHVTCLYRRDRVNMPGSKREVGHAEEEGVRFEWLAAPKSVGASVNAVRMRLDAPDASGRRQPVEVEGSDFKVEADTVIEALGYEAEDVAGLFGEPGLTTTARGTLRVNPLTLETDMPGVFAAGDIVRGASLVVWAIRDGRVAANAMVAALKAGELGGGASVPLVAAE